MARGRLAAATADHATTHRTTSGSLQLGTGVPPGSGQDVARCRLAAATADHATTHRTTSGSLQLGTGVPPGSMRASAAGTRPSSPARQDGASERATDTR
ncbi:hypothetical protein OG342_03590 [Streptomyces bobili]|uniref:hypothetical protein n=1 Tax=Streptomyces bobili TaxID=67280 RepID=UPI00225007E0|nr:hypothetical protein [Streptomyces bobili]MCX5521952.1 hypothetical protein [Streptomyces bobili]